MPHRTRSPDSESCTLEPIAICGMSCRLPGAVDSASSLWDMLLNKRSGQMDEVPKSRFNIDAHYHKNLDRPGSFNVRGGYFLDGQPEDFDPTAFNITPVEAQWLDPQQRKMLEVSYECLESAGLTLDSVAGSNTAVFVGSFTSDYQQMSTKEPDFRHNYAATGVDPGIISNRIGNTFNLQGPSFTINTACSSSVYAIHFACHALRARDCDAAIAGGVNLIMTVDQHMNTAKLGILSPTSISHTFDESADGYGRAEGAGALYLKRLSDAIQHGDPVRGVIRSTAVNTNGKVPGVGITHPSVKGQELVVRMAYDKAGLDPSNTAYAELHGTGTPVGDPIEVRAISNALNDTRSKDQPLLIGAIKPNIGHSEAASGIFAVMKAALMTEAGVIPGVAHFNRINPSIKEKEWNVKVNVDSAPWPAGFPARRASVSSFGYGGTNGHVIVESVKALHPWYQHGATKREADYDHSTNRPLVLCFSAHDKPTLTRNIAAVGKVADQYYPSDLAFTLNSHRTIWAQRAFTIVQQGHESEAFAETSLKYGAAGKKSPRVAYLFTGQGAQWSGMGAAAMLTFPSFHETIRSLDKVLMKLQPKPSFSLQEVLLGTSYSDRFNDAEISQPLCTAIQIAIVDLFEQWGIEPSVTIGHSSGEIGAAYAAGLLSAPEAILAAFYRGYAVERHAPLGAMLAVGLGAEEAYKFIQKSTEDVVIACENSPGSVTLSGQVLAVSEIKRQLDTEGIFAKELKTGKAYHSPHMVPVSAVYIELLTKANRRLDTHDLEWRQPRSRMISSVTGEEITQDHLNALYWSDNLRNRVRFDAAVSALGNITDLDGFACIVEIGPHSALAGPFKQICTANKFDHFNYISSLLRNSDDVTRLLSVAGSLFLNDYPVDLEAVNDTETQYRTISSLKRSNTSLLVDLPPYQWNYSKKYWAEPRSSAEQRSLTHARHDILGTRLSGLSDRIGIWRNVLRHRDIPWLQDHTLGNAAVFPAAAHMSLAIEALRQIHEVQELPFKDITLRDVDMTKALVIPETNDGVEIQLRLQQVSETPERTGYYAFAVESMLDGEWTSHCTGTIAANTNALKTEQDYSSPVKLSKLTQSVPGKRWYDAFSRIGFDYSRSFQQLQHVRTDRRYHEAAAEVSVIDQSGLIQDESRYVIHPATVDACLQLIIISIHAGMHKEMPWGVVPIRIDEVNFWSPGVDLDSTGNAIAWTDGIDGRYFNTHTKLMGKSGNLIMSVKNLRCVAYEAAVPPKAAENHPRQKFMENVWKPDISILRMSQLVEHCHGLTMREAVKELLNLLDHKHCLMNLLLLGCPNEEDLAELLEDLPTLASVTIAYIAEEPMEAQKSSHESDSRISTFLFPKNTTSWANLDLNPQDLIIVSENLVQDKANRDVLQGLKNFVGQRGWLIAPAKSTYCDDMISDLSSSSWSVSQLQLTSTESILFCDTTSPTNEMNRLAQKATILFVNNGIDLNNNLVEAMTACGADVTIKPIKEFDSSKDLNVVLPDCVHTLLTDSQVDTFEALRAVLCAPVSVLWLVKGVKEGKSASAGGIVEGFLRVIRSEQPAVKVALLDYDTDVDVKVVAMAIVDILGKVGPTDSGTDTEFWLHQGALHIARVSGNKALNNEAVDRSLAAESQILRPNITLTGNLTEGELHFQSALFDEKDLLGEGQVEIQVMAADLSKNICAPTLVVGTVLRVGSKVGSFFIGKKVVAFAPRSLLTIIHASIWELVDSELDSTCLLSSLSSLCPAVNASVRTATIQSKQRVLLLPGPMALLRTLILLSQIFNWRVTVVARNLYEENMYVDELGMSAGNVLQAENIKGIIDFVQQPLPLSPSVVIAHDFSGLSKEVWRHITPLGRFVLNEAPFDSVLDPLPFTRGASFLPARATDLISENEEAGRALLKLSLSILLAHQLRLTVKPKIYDIGASNLQETFDSDAAVVKYDYERSLIQVRPVRDVYRFSADATYLLVGCLGGLGRSLTMWMMERGTRHFAFISRSGADKPEAAEVIEAIKQAGASSEVFRADASNENDVSDIVKKLTEKRPIRGVVHAAMVLKDGIYEKMSSEDFQAAVVPKVKAAQSLDKALQGIDLDFFVMTSSISATLGNPGQSNYSAANSFLDSLAWQRNHRYQAATSLVLPMVLDVGIVSQNENIEISLNRKGMYGIDEQEMLHGFEIAMSQPVPSPTRPIGSMGSSQIILGLEPMALAKAISSSESVDAYWYEDSRLRRIRAAVEIIRNQDSCSAGKKGGDFSKTLKDALGESVDAAINAVAQHVMKRCSGILMVPIDSFEMDGSSIASYGLDSMIGTELRTWLFKEFALDVPFQKLLAPSLTFRKISVEILQSVGELPPLEEA